MADELSKRLQREQIKVIRRADRMSPASREKTPLYMGGKGSGAIYTNLSKTGENIYGQLSRDIDSINKKINENSNSKYTPAKDIYQKLAEIDLLSLDNIGLKRLAKYVSEVNSLLNKMEELKDSSNAIDQAKVRTLEGSLNTYKLVIDSLSDHFNLLKQQRVFNPESYSATIQSIDGMSLVNESDRELLKAFEFIGSPLIYDSTSGKLKRDETVSSNGFRLSPEDKPYHLDAKVVDTFIANYLDKPESERNGKVISPAGLFRFYVEDMVQNSSATRADKSIVENVKKMAEGEFSVQNDQWQSFLLDDNLTVRRDAIRYSLAEVFVDSVKSDIPELNHKELETKIADTGSKTLYRMVDFAEKSQSKIETMFNENPKEFGSVDNVVEKYTEERNGLISDLTYARSEGKDTTEIEKRIDNVEKSLATIVAINQVYEQVFKTVIEHTDFSNKTPETILLSPEKRKLELIKHLAQELGTMGFLSVQKDEKGNWKANVSTSILPQVILDHQDELVSKGVFQTEMVDGKPKIIGFGDRFNYTLDNVVDHKVQHGDNLHYEVSDIEKLKLSTEDIYDTCWNSLGFIEGDALEYTQSLENEVIFDRTRVLTNDGTDFSLLSENKDIGFGEFVSSLSALDSDGSGVDNPLYSPDTLKRIEDPNLNKNENDKASKAYVMMYRLGNAINKDQDLLEMIADGRSNTAEFKAKMRSLYKRTKDGIEKTPPSQEEIDRAKHKFKNLNLKKGYERFETYKDKEGVCLFEELARSDKSSKITDALKARKLTLDEEHKKLLDEEHREMLDGIDPDKDIESKRNAPYKFKDKYGKNDGSETLKKLKPYCAKTADKFLENILKMIDSTMITPKSEAKKEAPESIDPKTPKVAPKTDDATPTPPVEEVKVEEHTDEEVKEPTPEEPDPEKVEKEVVKEEPVLAEEITDRGRFAYLICSRIMSRAVREYDKLYHASKYDEKYKEMLGNEDEKSNATQFEHKLNDERESINNLVLVQEYIGKPETSAEDVKLKSHLMDIIESKFTKSKTAEPFTKEELESIQDEKLREAIEYITDHNNDDINILWALGEISQFKERDGKVVLELAAKVPLDVIQNIAEGYSVYKNQGAINAFVDRMLEENGIINDKVIIDALNMWTSEAENVVNKAKTKTYIINDEGKIVAVDHTQPEKESAEVVKEEAEVETPSEESEEMSEKEPEETFSDERPWRANDVPPTTESKTEEPSAEEKLEKEWEELLRAKAVITGKDGVNRKDARPLYMVEVAKKLIKENRLDFTLETAKKFIEEARENDNNESEVRKRLEQYKEAAKQSSEAEDLSSQPHTNELTEEQSDMIKRVENAYMRNHINEEERDNAIEKIKNGEGTSQELDKWLEDKLIKYMNALRNEECQSLDRN